MSSPGARNSPVDLYHTPVAAAAASSSSPESSEFHLRNLQSAHHRSSWPAGAIFRALLISTQMPPLRLLPVNGFLFKFQTQEGGTTHHDMSIAPSELLHGSDPWWIPTETQRRQGHRQIRDGHRNTYTYVDIKATDCGETHFGKWHLWDGRKMVLPATFVISLYIWILSPCGVVPLFCFILVCLAWGPAGHSGSD